MDILISFTNAYKTPGSPCLGLLNTDTMEFNVVELPLEVPQTGMLGLAISSKYILIGLQHSYDRASYFPFEEAKTYSSPPALLIFDRNDFKLLHKYIFQIVKDVHSLLLSNDEANLYVVSSGTDEVVKIQLDGSNVVSEEVFWRPEPEGKRSDNYHLNSIYGREGNIYISGFGKKADGESWNTALNGFIYNITKGEQIISGLQHPHSVVFTNGQTSFCESLKRRLRFLGDERTVDLPGYVRGLCLAADKLFVGISASRRKSKSTGKLITNADSLPSECTISRIDPRSLEVEAVLSLKDYAYEIYDLLPVEETSKWPLRKPVNYLQQLEKLWKDQVDLALKEIRIEVPKGENIILVDDYGWPIDNTEFNENHYLRFMEKEGTYFGPPQNEDIAIQELKRLQNEENSRFIAFGWPAFWWLNYFPSMHDYIKNNFICIIDNERLVLFDMQKKELLTNETNMFVEYA